MDLQSFYSAFLCLAASVVDELRSLLKVRVADLGTVRCTLTLVFLPLVRREMCSGESTLSLCRPSVF